MSLKSLSYTEFENDPRCWKFEQSDFTQINLIVGRNATGKTRLIRVINGLCKVLSAQLTQPFTSGSYHAEIILSDNTYSLFIEFADGKVIRELLQVDGEIKLTRDADGSGEIYYEQQKTFIKFQVSPTVIVMQQRRDELQHPFIVELSKWASEARAYFFGSSFGKDKLVGLSSLEASILNKDSISSETDDLVHIYTIAFNKFQAPFDIAIIRDMQRLGYNLTDVGAEDIRQLSLGITLPEPVIGMTVKESDRPSTLTQLDMSQGMFRALALVIHINIAAFSKRRTLVLVDDIGEGLDFERSASLIDVLIDHAKETGLQVIMTTNDRFVMNRVPLEYWSLLRRKGGTISAYTERNSQKEFSEFKFMGLSNFDFFTSSTFE